MEAAPAEAAVVVVVAEDVVAAAVVVVGVVAADTSLRLHLSRNNPKRSDLDAPLLFYQL